MEKSKQWLSAAKQLCNELGPEDGIDPRYLARQKQGKSRNHKGKQLCKEAKRTLALVLAGEVSDPLLQNLAVDDVVTNDQGEFLWITLKATGNATATKINEIEMRLQSLQGFLRAAVAQSVRRKRVPALKFRVMTATEEVSNYANSKNNH